MQCKLGAPVLACSEDFEACNVVTGGSDLGVACPGCAWWGCARAGNTCLPDVGATRLGSLAVTLMPLTATGALKTAEDSMSRDIFGLDKHVKFDKIVAAQDGKCNGSNVKSPHVGAPTQINL